MHLKLCREFTGLDLGNRTVFSAAKWHRAAATREAATHCRNRSAHQFYYLWDDAHKKEAAGILRPKVEYPHCPLRKVLRAGSSYHAAYHDIRSGSPFGYGGSALT